jgi:hypothetical protein
MTIPVPRRLGVAGAHLRGRRAKRRAANVAAHLGELPPDLEAARAQLRDTAARIAEWALEHPEVPELVSAKWTRLEAAIAQAFEDGDSHRAVRAIEKWESHARRILHDKTKG